MKYILAFGAFFLLLYVAFKAYVTYYASTLKPKSSHVL